MKSFRWIILAAGLVVPAFLAVGVFGQGATGVNTPVGYIWTYLGPTFGAGWAPPAQLTPGPPGPPGLPGPAGPAASCVNIVAYGAVGDDVFDNVAAFNAAKIANKCLEFPAGIFRFNSGVSWALTADNAGMTILGAGQDVTVLHFPNAVGTALSITKNKPTQSAHIRDFTMTTGTSNVDIGIKVQQTVLDPVVEPTGYATSDITRVTLRADQGYQGASVTHTWSRAINIIDDSVWDLTAISVYGTLPAGGYPTVNGPSGYGIVLEGTVKGTGNQGVPVVFNISRANLNWLNAGILIGQAIQGVQISQSNIVGCYSGIGVPQGMAELDELSISTSQFNNVISLNINSTFNLIGFANNTVYVPLNGDGIAVFKPSRVAQINGNAFLGTSSAVGTGIRFEPDVNDDVAPIITGNTFFRLATGVLLAGQARGTLMAANMFAANARNILNQALDNVASTNLNLFTGGTGLVSGALLPAYADVGGAVNNGSGQVRLTVNQTSTFNSGMYVLVGAVGGISGIGSGQFRIVPIRVVDATHMDLLTISFAGTYTSGGAVSSVPP